MQNANEGLVRLTAGESILVPKFDLSIEGIGREPVLPRDEPEYRIYVVKSGDSLSGSATYAFETFASIGLTPGTYVWSWGSGGSADSLTLNIVPEPTAVFLLATGLAALAWRLRRSL